MTAFVRVALVAAMAWGALCGCNEDVETVVVYCSVDEQFARGVLKEFERRTQVRTLAVYDSEAGKTTGLVNRIRAERGRPRADVLFSGEVFNTILLAQEGLLASYDPPPASDIPRHLRGSGQKGEDKNTKANELCWTGIGLRGRVLAYDPMRTALDDLPQRWEEFAYPRWAPRVALGNPMFGTTRGHVAAMFALWGKDRTTAFLVNLKDAGALVVDGNSSALRAVIDGRAEMCMTDTDDVWVAQRDGASVALKYLDMGDGGTLWIPSSVALIEGGPNRANGELLVDYLVSEEVERMLAESRSRNIPVRAALRESLGVDEVKTSHVSYRDIAGVMDESSALVREILLK